MGVKHRMFRSQVNRVEKSVGKGVILRRENLERIFKANLKTKMEGGANLDGGANIEIEWGRDWD